MSVDAPKYVTLDAGALIAVDARDRRVWATLEIGRRDGWTMVVPAGALAQVWRDPPRQANLAAFLRWRGIRIEPLTEHVARRAGVLCGRRGTRDVVDASVALCAHDLGGRVMTSDPDGLLHLVPTLRIVALG